MHNRIIFFSGGMSSFTVAHLVKERHPEDNILLYFTDTLWEDPDLYRFIYEASDKLKLPMLYHSVGLTPPQVMVLERFMANSRAGTCSQRLKMEPAAAYLFGSEEPKIVKHYNWDYLKAEIDPQDANFVNNTTLYFGIGWDEAHREPKIKANWEPFNVEMPLMDEVINNKEVLDSYGIAVPQLYEKGFAHNNCQAKCVKAGQAHFKNLYEKDRKTYIELMEQEAVISEYIRYTKQPHVNSGKTPDHLFDDVWAFVTDGTKSQKIEAILRNSMLLKHRKFGWQPRNKTERNEPYSFITKQKDRVKFAYPLHDLRADIVAESPDIDAFDFGGCGCFIDDDSSESCDLTALLEAKQKEQRKEKTMSVQIPEVIKTINIDIETYSSNDLVKGGVYKYVEADDFTILIFAYSINGGSVEVLDLADELDADEIPPHIIYAILNPNVTKYAFNAQFERVCISEYLRRQGEKLAGKYLDPKGWRCTMVDATRLGLPATLEKAGAALKLDVQKDKSGKDLIRYFSLPCKGTKANGGRTRNMPYHDVEKWDAFKRYCGIDVESEMAIQNSIKKYLHIGSENDLFEQELYWHDQRINDRGVELEMDLAYAAMDMWDEYTDRLKAETKHITGLSNPNSPTQLKAWLATEGIELPGLTKAHVGEALKSGVPTHVAKVLENRQELGKTSVKKYNAMEAAVCADNRVRGLLQINGAGRTGRWAGRLVQVQNLPQNKIDDIENARSIVLGKDLDWLEMMYDRVPFVLSQLIRTTFVPKHNTIFAVSDFSAIEARVIAWVAGEQWRLDVFKTHGKIYEASASQMFHVPISSIGKGSPLRQKGKVAELALGYGGGPNALISMGALAQGVEEDELPVLVKAWRKANPKVTKLWKDFEAAAKRAISRPGEVIALQFGIKFYKRDKFLFVVLPSGRHLAYYNARVEDHPTFGGTQIAYDGVDGTTKKWTTLYTYGGKLTENIIQAIARDCLAESMLALARKGYTEQVMHVHDEIVIETQENSIRDIEAIMAEPISWAPGLPLEADGFETAFYKKD